MRTLLLAGRYRLGPVIGSGGSGSVHRAHDERLDRDVAVKVLRTGATAADGERLRREVEYLRAVQHPNLVAVLDAGTVDATDDDRDRAWFAMELVGGPDLATVLHERGTMSGAAVRRLLTGVLGALEAMHAAGLVHRDVTPSNILLTADPFARWEARLTDLGIAQRLLAAPLTDAGQVVGTAAYLSPEQVRGGGVGPATDVYALALVALEALTGDVPFPGSAVESATARLVRPPALPEGLDPAWRDLLLAATAVDPAARPRAAALRERVEALPDDAGLRPRSDGRARDVVLARTARMPVAATNRIPAMRLEQPTRRLLPSLLVAGSALVLTAVAVAGVAAVAPRSGQAGRQVAVSADRSTATPSAAASGSPSAEAAAPAAQAAQQPADDALAAARPGPGAAGQGPSGPASRTDAAAAGPAAGGPGGGDPAAAGPGAAPR